MEAKLYNSNPIYITGGAGFIGSAVIWGLNKIGQDNIVVVDNLGTSEKWKNLVNRRYAGFIHRDEFLRLIRDDALKSSPAAIIHLGACSSTTERNADFLMENNTHYSQAVCQYALNKGARFINASSAATYGRREKDFLDNPAQLEKLQPLNMYGYSKHLFDLWLKRNALLDKVASLKFFNVYGPNEYHKGDMASVVMKAFHQIRRAGEIKLFRSASPAYNDGEQKRDFVYVKDCVEIILRLLENPQLNGILNVGTGTARSWNDLASSVFTAMNVPKKIEYVEMPSELIGKYQNYTKANMNWIKKIWPDFQFYSLESGINDYITNYLLQADPYLEMQG